MNFSNLILILTKISVKVFNIFTSLWLQLGGYLQCRHQKQKNNKTCKILLEHDEYRLRDVGLTRNIVKEYEIVFSHTNVAQELQKFRTTKGRDLS